MGHKQNKIAKFILLSKIETIENLQNVQFFEDDKIWIIPVCCMIEEVEDRITLEKVFLTDEGQGKKYRNILITKGANPANISLLNYYDILNKDDIHDIMSSQYIVFTGGRMELGIERLKKLGMDLLLQNYKGTIVGVSAGALMLFTEYLITPNFFYKNLTVCEGLGYIDSRRLMIEVHFSETDPAQKQAVELISVERKQPIYAIRQSGYLIVQDNVIIQCNDVIKI